MTTVKDNLIAARALIDTPEKWIRDRIENAGCFCAMGAIAEATRTQRGGVWTSETAEYAALRDALPEGGTRSVPTYNDNRSTTHADIMALFDRAIEAETTKETK